MKLAVRVTKKPRIELIALLDSVFLILVFFIYAFLSMTVHHGMPVDLPVASNSIVDKKDYYSISVTDKDEIYFNKQLVSLDILDHKIEAVKLKDRKPRVYLAGDTNAKHGTIVKIFDVLKKHSIKNISIETTAEENI